MIQPGYWHELRERMRAAQGKNSAGAKDEAEEQKILDSYLAVTFSKQVLLFLLAQHGCEGVRFYFCTNHLGGKSLVLVGVNEKDDDIGAPNGSIIPKKGGSFTEAENQATAIFEVGGPKTVKDYQAYFNDNKANLRQASFVKTVGEYFDL